MGKNASENELDKMLEDVYKKHGLKLFLQVCHQMLQIKDKHDYEKKAKTNGEVCEVVLNVMTKHYIKKKGLKGETFHSLVLPNKDDKRSDFRTELDFTVLTPCICMTGECKSYSGDIIVTGDCLLHRGKDEIDVGRQSLLHGKYLAKYLRDYTLPNISQATPPYGLFCFVYSNGTITDKRPKDKRQMIPVLTVNTLYKYYDGLFNRYRKEVYQYERARKQFRTFANSQAMHDQHKKFLGY